MINKNRHTPLTTIVILNWNGLENTRRCLDSLLKVKYDNYKVIVIDNGSSRNEARILRKEFKTKIDVHRLEENTGFTGGVNYGIKIASSKYDPDYFLLLNNDTEVKKDFLKYLVQTAKSSKLIGIVGSIIFDFRNRKKILYSGGDVNWLLAKPYRKRDYHNTVKEESIVTGCSMLIKKDVIKQVGLLDERFFAYFEDSAYCLKTKNAGYKCVCDGRSVVYHIENATSGRNSILFTYLFSRNRILFVNNYTSTIYRLYFFVFNFFKLLYVEIYYLLSGQVNRSKAYIKGYVHGVLGKAGKPAL